LGLVHHAEIGSGLATPLGLIQILGSNTLAIENFNLVVCILELLKLLALTNLDDLNIAHVIFLLFSLTSSFLLIFFLLDFLEPYSVLFLKP
jgi:hypothetical protein